MLGDVQGVLGDLQNNPIGAALDGFWNSWSDLANHTHNLCLKIRSFAQASDLEEQIEEFGRETITTGLHSLSGPGWG